jgi:hypothetical protein
MIFSKTYRDRAAAAMTSSKICRNRAAMDISDIQSISLVITVANGPL